MGGVCSRRRHATDYDHDRPTTGRLQTPEFILRLWAKQQQQQLQQQLQLQQQQ